MGRQHRSLWVPVYKVKDGAEGLALDRLSGLGEPVRDVLGEIVDSEGLEGNSGSLRVEGPVSAL